MQQQNNIDNRVAIDQLQLLFKQSPQTFVSSSAISAMLLYLLWDNVSHSLLLSWFIIILCGNCSRLFLINAYHAATEHSAKRIKLWLQRFMIITCAAGLSWGIGITLFLQQAPETYQFLIIMILSAVSAGALPAYTNSLLTYRLFLIPCLFVPSVWMMLQTNELLMFTGMMVTLFAGLMLSLNKRQYNAITESLSLRYENTNLLEDMEMEITERKRNEEKLSSSQAELKQKTTQLQSLLRLAKALEQADSYPKIMQAVSLEIKQVFGLNHTWIYLITDSPDEWKLLSPGGNDHLKLKDKLPTLKIRGDRMLEEIAAAVGPVIIEDARLDPRTNKEIVSQLGNRTIINIPMMLAENRVGTLGTGTFFDEGLYHLSAEQEVQLLAMASHVALAVDRVRLFSERLEIQSQMEHAQRLDSLGLMAGGIAHDFNNILTSIMGHAALAEMDALSDPGATKDYVRRIVDSSQRAADLCHQMLAYSGKGKFIIEEIDLSCTVEGLGPLLDASIGKQADICYQLAKELPLIEVDVAQLQQVIMNLVINASEAMHEQTGEIVVSTGLTFADDNYLAKCYSISPVAGQYVFLEVSDNGCGMSPETAAKVFDPFFTTKFTGRGLGMSAILGIVRGHQGGIFLDTEIGNGTTFRILFPALEHTSASPSAKPEATASVISPDHPSGKILIIDDEEGVRDMSAAILEHSGFEVLCAIDGEDGLKLYKQHQSEISLVILDLTMPKMNGSACYKAMCQVNPEVKVILISGYSEEESMQYFDGVKPVSFVSKPFMPETFLAEVFKTLSN